MGCRSEGSGFGETTRAGWRQCQHFQKMTMLGCSATCCVAKGAHAFTFVVQAMGILRVQGVGPRVWGCDSNP